jgi:hypothetical protein
LGSNLIVAIEAKSLCFGIPSLGGRFANIVKKNGKSKGERRRIEKGKSNTSMNVDVTLGVPLGRLLAAL